MLPRAYLHGHQACEAARSRAALARMRRRAQMACMAQHRTHAQATKGAGAVCARCRNGRSVRCIDEALLSMRTGEYKSVRTQRANSRPACAWDAGEHLESGRSVRTQARLQMRARLPGATGVRAAKRKCVRVQRRDHFAARRLERQIGAPAEHPCSPLSSPVPGDSRPLPTAVHLVLLQCDALKDTEYALRYAYHAEHPRAAH